MTDSTISDELDELEAPPRKRKVSKPGSKKRPVKKSRKRTTKTTPKITMKTGESTRRQKKEKPAVPESKGPTKKELKEMSTGKETLKRKPSAGDFNWKPLKRKNVWDGSYGMWLSRDPMSKWGNYPATFVTDPVTNLPMKRVKSYDRFGDGEAMFKVTRKDYLKENPDDDILPVEYFAISAEVKPSGHRFVIAVSFGSTGKDPADKLD